MNVARPTLAVVSLLLNAAIVVGCDRGSAPVAGANPPTDAAAHGSNTDSRELRKLPTTQMTLAGRPFQIEMALNEPDQERGLMWRTSMGANEGMIFVFPQKTDVGFYMKNTLIPLDIAFIDDDGSVLNVAQMYPHDMSTTWPRGPYRYAIELNQGVAERIGLKAGDHVALPASFR